MTTYTFRSQAVEAAIRARYGNFRTYRGEDDMWRMAYEPGESPADGFMARDYVSHAETDWDRSSSRPEQVGVLVVTCRLDEIPADDLAEYDRLNIRLEPLTPSLWDSGKGGTGDHKGARHASTGARERSSAASPVKIVWRIADEMIGKPRSEVIAACVAEGVHKSTASTQYYRWQKAKSA